ncbi:MAG: NAD(P)-binding domain-containing protein, partial [Roseovarius sp.]
MRLGFLGTGTIAEAVVRGLAPDGHQITVSERSAVRAARLA